MTTFDVSMLFKDFKITAKKETKDDVKEKKKDEIDLCGIFESWLAGNGHRFNRKYRVRHRIKDNSLWLYFEGVNPAIHFNVLYNLCASVGYRGRFWDFLEDFDCWIKRGRNRKYYCGFCTERKYYKTPEELVINHTFETFLEWFNEQVTSDHVLELMHSRGMTRARIIDKRKPAGEVAADQEEFKIFLSRLKSIKEGNPPMFKNPSGTKIEYLPVIVAGKEE